jgi:hypothetical protein
MIDKINDNKPKLTYSQIIACSVPIHGRRRIWLLLTSRYRAVSKRLNSPHKAELYDPLERHVNPFLLSNLLGSYKNRNSVL